MLFDKVKFALHKTKNDFDSEIRDLIDAASDDLRSVGIHVADTPLCTQAIIAYAKWRFGEGAPEWEPIYNSGKEQLKHSSKYGGAYGQIGTD